MEFNKETVLLQNEIRKFAKDVIAPKVDENDKQYKFPLDNLKQLAKMGVLGAIVPEQYGGAALDTVSTLAVLEEISRVCPSTALVTAVHNALFVYPILRFGNDEMKKKYLPKAGTGEIIGGYAEKMTSEIISKAESENYVLSGKNPLLLNATSNGPFIIAVQIGNDIHHIVIDTNTPGIVRNKKDNVIGMHAAGINEVVFSNCSIPKSVLLGIGADIFEDIKNLAKLFFSAVALGIAEGAMENALKYAKERVQFGTAIVNFGMVREMIADMVINIESARLLIYDAAQARDTGKDYTRGAAIARYFINQAVAEITTNAIQVYGGYGYMKDYPAERFFRDAQVIRVLCGSSVEEKELIAQKTI